MTMTMVCGHLQRRLAAVSWRQRCRRGQLLSARSAGTPQPGACEQSYRAARRGARRERPRRRVDDAAAGAHRRNRLFVADQRRGGARRRCRLKAGGDRRSRRASRRCGPTRSVREPDVAAAGGVRRRRHRFRGDCGVPLRCVNPSGSFRPAGRGRGVRRVRADVGAGRRGGRCGVAADR